LQYFNLINSGLVKGRLLCLFRVDNEDNRDKFKEQLNHIRRISLTHGKLDVGILGLRNLSKEVKNLQVNVELLEFSLQEKS
jgi:hypothetical protein